MKTKLLVVALVLALLANVALWLQLQLKLPRTDANVPPRSADARRAALAQSRTVDASVGSDAAADRRGVLWRQPKTAADWREFAKELRAAGFPEDSIRMIVDTAIYHAARNASGLAKLPFWHRFSNGKSSQTENEKLQRALRALSEEVFGKREWDPATADPVYVSTRFGDLPADKIRALMKIEQDYGDIYWQQRRANANEDALESYEGRARIRLLEEEKERDLAAMLTPEQFEDYERRGSRAAQTVIQGVRDIDVSEEEYNALFELQRRALAAIPREAGPDEALAYARNGAASAEAVRAVLGDDRFSSYMANTDPLYGAAANFAKSNPSLTPAATNALYQLQLDAMTAAAKAAAPGRTSDLANMPEGRAALAPFAAKLEALLGPELAAAYRKTPAGKIFADGGRP